MNDPNRSDWQDHRTETPGVYRRRDHFRVLTRIDGRKVMHRFDTYEDAVAFKATIRTRRGGRIPRRNPHLAYLLRDPCPYCGAPSQTFDHIEPQILGGEHHWSNVTGACENCNYSKQEAPLLLFLLRRRLTPRITEGRDLFALL